MKNTAFAILTVGNLTAVALAAQSPTPVIAVVRDPDCTCCLKWVAHLEQAGFAASVSESSEMESVKDAKGVPAAARSCHTGTVAGYVIEGHVPADDIKRLLTERPNVAGLVVAGMPAGSPGMESTIGRVTPYEVLAFDSDGQTSVFASHR